MAKDIDDFTRELQQAFVGEAREQVQTIVDSLIKLEGVSETADKDKLVESAFRETHNLKGSARAVGFTTIEMLCHPLEDLMAALKRKQIQPEPNLLDLMLSTIALVERLLDNMEDQQALSEIGKTREHIDGYMKTSGVTASPMGSDPYLDGDDQPLEVASVSIVPEPEKPATAPVQTKQAAAAEKQQPAKQPTPQKIVATSTAEKTETLRISAGKLDLFMYKAEEMLSIKAMARQQSIASQQMQQKLEERTKTWVKAAPDVKAARVLMEKMRNSALSPQEQIIWRRMSDLLDWNSEFIDGMSADIKGMVKTSHDVSHATSTAVDILLDETKRLLMMPCSSLFEGFPLLVRQLARELGKEVDVTINGGEIELDKRILGQVKDPLTHLLRNAVDHGMETADERAARGKNRRGSIGIAVQQVDGSQVEIRVMDDGRGIDAEAVKASAIRMGLLSQEEAAKLTRDDALALIFRSSLSTSQIITEISGRGIGMAVVEENIRKLGGRVRIETEIGKGTTFVIHLPVTIATFRGVLVDVRGKTFVVPTTSIDRVVRIKKDDIKPVEGTSTMLLGESLIPLCQMEDVLELPSVGTSEKVAGDMMTVAVLGSGEGRVGFVVDEVLEEQEVLVKTLGLVLAGTPNVAGVTILGSGKVVPILNSSDMLRSSRKHSFSRSKRQTAKPVMHTNKVNGNGNGNGHGRKNSDKKILVVDDTLTARILMRNIFESAGFTIKTANDGLEALSAIKNDTFDLVVTDIEMPRMNGFELTEQIRQDPGSTNLPVIIVTSMTSREDRERGVASGANAYFVKSSFDQSNLLDVVGTLV